MHKLSPHQRHTPPTPRASLYYSSRTAPATSSTTIIRKWWFPTKSASKTMQQTWVDMPWMAVESSCLALLLPQLTLPPSYVLPVAATATSTAVTLMMVLLSSTTCHRHLILAQVQVQAQPKAQVQALAQPIPHHHQFHTLTTLLHPTCCWP